MITHALLKSWNPCTDGYKCFCELFPDGADLQTVIDGLVADEHDDWGYWLFCRARDKNLFTDVTSKGYLNTGYLNTGDLNTGNLNTGDLNTCDLNTGDLNTGDLNTGDLNTGNWNTGSLNTGYFNTTTPDTIPVFGKACKRSDWDSAYKPSFLFFDVTEWVPDYRMTDQEKTDNPTFFTTGGYLKAYDYKEAFKKSWDNANPDDRMRVKDLPNFDAEIFYEVSGIDLREEN